MSQIDVSTVVGVVFGVFSASVSLIGIYIAWRQLQKNVSHVGLVSHYNLANSASKVAARNALEFWGRKHNWCETSVQNFAGLSFSSMWDLDRYLSWD